MIFANMFALLDACSRELPLRQIGPINQPVQPKVWFLIVDANLLRRNSTS